MRKRGYVDRVPYRVYKKRKNDPKKNRYNNKCAKVSSLRWTIERAFSWLNNYRALKIRYDRNLDSYMGTFHFVAGLIISKKMDAG